MHIDLNSSIESLVTLAYFLPNSLQSDNGSEFTAQITSDLKELWPELVIVQGKPRHPQSQGSVERANYDIKDMLVAWKIRNRCRSVIYVAHRIAEICP
jgi:transposase InsO family protein